MKAAIVLLNNHIREVFEKSTTWFIIVFFTQILTLLLILYVYMEHESEAYHYYMNTKTSLEEIHNVKLDKYDGRIEKELTTEDILLRKQNRKWHLKYIFK